MTNRSPTQLPTLCLARGNWANCRFFGRRIFAGGWTPELSVQRRAPALTDNGRLPFQPFLMVRQREFGEISGYDPPSGYAEVGLWGSLTAFPLRIAHRKLSHPHEFTITLEFEAL